MCNYIEQNLCFYTYPDHEQTIEVVGVYQSWKKVYMDEPMYYLVYTDTGECLNNDDTVWSRVPTRDEVREHYVEITYS